MKNFISRNTLMLIKRASCLFIFLALISSCAVSQEKSGGPGVFREKGLASWYGIPYHGRKTASGEVYDMYGISAAHKTLPLGTVCTVENLKNGRKMNVRINDRGPFVDGRIIDLSLGAARELDFVEQGITDVVIEAVSLPDVRQVFTIQVASYREEKNALRMKNDLQGKYGGAYISTYDSGGDMFYRVRVGKFPNIEEAKKFLRKIDVRDSVPFVVSQDL